MQYDYTKTAVEFIPYIKISYGKITSNRIQMYL
jgi:hypothetical protein